MAKAKALEAEVRMHQALYDAGKPEITDAAFDKLIAKLRKASPGSPVLAEVGRAATSRRAKHLYPMLSLEKATTLNDVLAWCRKASDGYVVAPKYDGVSLSLTYRAGKLVQALSRGDGEVGDDVTHNVKLIPVIPQTVHPKSEIVVRGELILQLDRFPPLQKAYEFSNPRNAIAGTLMRVNPAEDVLKQASFIAYDVLGSEYTHLTDALVGLSSWGFEVGESVTVPFGLPKSAIAKMTATCQDPHFPFEADGLVIKLDRYKMRDTLGATSHHPRWAIALKFPAQPAQSVLRSVVWQVSRSGTITPVGLVDPVKLSGAVVSRVTLHNLRQMRELGATRKDAVVEMTRRGGVIPHVERVIEPGTGKPIAIPERCPCCNEAAYEHDGFLYCSETETCPDAQRERLLFWAQQTDMLGWGESVIASLYNDGLAMQPSELYTQDVATMRELFGSTLGSKLYKEANTKATMPANVFIRALGLPHIGNTHAIRLARHFGKIEAMLAWARSNDALELEGFGTILVDALRGGLLANETLIDNLLKVVTVLPVLTPEEGPLSGKRFVFTGKLADMEREEAAETVTKLGAVAQKSVTSQTTHLVVADASTGDTTKVRAAVAQKERGRPIEILNEAEFTKLLVSALAQK